MQYEVIKLGIKKYGCAICKFCGMVSHSSSSQNIHTMPIVQERSMATNGSRPYHILIAIIFWCTFAGILFQIGVNIPRLNQTFKDEDLSLCSEKATQLGKGQKVVSFSLFRWPGSGNPSKPLERYLPGIQQNLVAIREFYPGWLMRIYTNMEGFPESLQSEPDLFICNSTSLPKIGNVTNIDGMLWRFLPIADPTVDLFLVRDLDSIINNREQEAVTEWLQSNQTFHSMRDHPLHSIPILGGMWGSKNMLLDKYDREYLLQGFLKGTDPGGNDQNVLSAVLYKKYSLRFLEHDSYRCQTFTRSVPFPKQRKGNTQFVGGVKLHMSPNKKVNPCPVACRPVYGKDWKYC